MIFARLDVRIPFHRRFVKAGPAAVGYWAAALCYSRGEELDGKLPPEAVGLILGLGDKAGRKLADRLCEPGIELFEKDGKGYRIIKYDRANETKAEIDERREETKKRVRKHRGNKPGNGGGNGPGNGIGNVRSNAVTNAFVPGSGSGSVSSGSPRSGSSPPPTLAQDCKGPGLASTLRAGAFQRSEDERVARLHAEALTRAAELSADPTFAAKGSPS